MKKPRNDSNDVTTHSERIEGDQGNYNWPATFDITPSGYLGITQSADSVWRVLLSPTQVKELRKFLRGKP